MNVISLCAGVGGLDLAFRASGFTVSGMAEWDEPARTVLQYRFPETPLLRDVKEMRGMDFGAADVIMGGFPCQDLSTGGKRAGLRGERSGLFFHFIRLVKEMRDATNGLYPQFLMLENVPGLLTSGDGEDFRLLLREVADSGAVDIGWRVLDSQHAGTPQRRRRVVVVADYRGRRAGQVLSLGTGMPGGAGPFGTVSPAGDTGESEDQPGAADRAVAYHGAGRTSTLMTAQAHGKYLQSGLASTLRARDGKGGTVDLIVEEQLPPTNWIDDLFDGLDLDDLFADLDDAAPAPRTVSYVRVLTPLEAERLQTFPDNWTLVPYRNGMMGKTHRYRMMGNSVTVRKFQQVAERMALALAQGQEVQHVI